MRQMPCFLGFGAHAQQHECRCIPNLHAFGCMNLRHSALAARIEATLR
jgi:hypothetical protein